MYAFTSGRRLAATTKPCANCGAPLPVPAGAARDAETLCSDVAAVSQLLDFAAAADGHAQVAETIRRGAPCRV